MNCLKSIRKAPVTADVFYKTTRLYYQMGRNYYYKDLFNNNYENISKSVADKDAYAFFKIFFSEYKISESRMKTLLLDSAVAKNNAEQFYKNLIRIFRQIKLKDVEPFMLNVTEIYDLVKILFHDTSLRKNIHYRNFKKASHSLLSKESSSMREKFEELIQIYDNTKKENTFEPLILSINFLVDFINMNIYTGDKNEMIGILLIYVILLNEGFISVNYVSFFSKLYLYKSELMDGIRKSKFQWTESLSEIMPLARLFIKIYSELYYDLSNKARDYEYESSLEISKSDYIENTIMKLGEIFSKEEIRKRHLLVSDSTINRTLKRLQDNGVIRALGKGRSAKWVKLIKTEKKISFHEQLNLNLGEGLNE